VRIISLANQKGGTGKTTTVANLGSALSQLNKKVLLIDLDPQSNLTIHFGIIPKNLPKTITDLLEGTTNYKDIILNTYLPNLNIIPSNTELTRIEINLANVGGRESVLKKKLHNLDGYDFVILDSPPALGLLTINGLTYAKELIIPLQVEFFALEGMVKLLETIAIVKHRINPEMNVTGIVATMYDIRTNLSHEVLTTIRNKFKEKVFKTVIRENIRLAEAPSFGKTIFDYSPTSYGAEDYLELAKEVINRG